MIIEPYYIFPGENGFKGSLLDEYLAAGYYRMLHTVFTIHHTQLEATGDALPVFWLRGNVIKIKENKTSLSIRKKCEAFTVTAKKAIITHEIEALYNLYHSSINFKTGESCRVCMHDSNFENPFDSWMIEVRDEATLVAVGYFDLGQQAITGILNFYHPAYKKYSLGKYLMLQKIDWARRNEIAWYYTGYICIGNSKFDYKIFPDAEALQVYLPVERKWVPYKLVGKYGLEIYWLRYINKELPG